MNEQNRTLGEQIEAQRMQQARVRLECEIRNAARELKADRHIIEHLVERSRVVFKIAGGEARPTESDGRTLLRREDGLVLSVREGARLLC